LGKGIRDTDEEAPLPCFLQEYDSMGLSEWGSAKNMIPNGLVAQEAEVLRREVFKSELKEATWWVPLPLGFL
jgi:hypothetical protein